MHNAYKSKMLIPKTEQNVLGILGF